MLKLLQFVLIILLIVVIECLPLDRFVHLSIKSNQNETDNRLQFSPGHSDRNSQSGFPPTLSSMEPPSSPYPSGPSPIGNSYPPGYPQSHPGMYPNMTDGNLESGGPDDEYDSELEDYTKELYLKTAKQIVEEWMDELVVLNRHGRIWVRSKVHNQLFPGSADSNSQGSYPQSTTPVQFEGPYPGHRQPPPGQGYPENQNYPHQGAINDYGPNHHPGQPPQQPPQQPPSNYGHLGGHLPPGIQQQMSQPPRQQSPHQNRKMMQGRDNNYPQPGNPAIGSHYPPQPQPDPGSGYPGAQHYQYPPYPYHQSHHGQYTQQHSQHPLHPQHPQHPSHQN
ncbi:calcium-binding protein P-like [Panonychus citri]|uniref:calcium-binding protein P-like n=1 Tax=Panonychus citri TaxID=50023 RepID=UPI0023075EF8|nr:calcium-binding protein P-like [Panonychus citri]